MLCCVRRCGALPVPCNALRCIACAVVRCAAPCHCVRLLTMACLCATKPVHCETVRRFACAVRSVALPCRRCELLAITPPVRPGVSPLVACAWSCRVSRKGVLDLICYGLPCKASRRFACALPCTAPHSLCRAVPCQSLPLLGLAQHRLHCARPRNASSRPAMPKHRGTMPLLRQGSHCHAHAVRCSAVQRLNIAHLALPLLGRASVRFACAGPRLALPCLC